MFFDGGYPGEAFVALGHLRVGEVAEVLAKVRRRIEKVLERAKTRPDDDNELALLTSVSGSPPAGPALRRGAVAPSPALESKLCVSDEGFNLHAATTAGAQDKRGREALLRYILRPPVAQERIVKGPDGLVRIALKKPFSDGTVAIDLDPLSLPVASVRGGARAALPHHPLRWGARLREQVAAEDRPPSGKGR